MKSIIDMRPVHHRVEQRIPARVLLCWLALLLIRIAETTTGQGWTQIRDELQRLPRGIHRPGRILPPARRTRRHPEEDPPRARPAQPPPRLRSHPPTP